MQEKEITNSSNIGKIRYDADKQLLEITFLTKKVFQYEAVPKRIWDNMLKAESVGKFFHKEVKDKFRAKQITV